MGIGLRYAELSIIFNTKDLVMLNGLRLIGENKVYLKKGENENA
jgi:hypothetical protein